MSSSFNSEGVFGLGESVLDGDSEEVDVREFGELLSGREVQ
jgi:hypothetical protein